MARITYDPERRALAYRIWREQNRNVSAALRVLETEYGWPLARQTLYDWMAEENWGERADAHEEAERRAKEQQEMGRVGILASLLKQKARYDKYFAKLDAESEMDHQAISAYTQLMRVIDAFQTKTVDREADQSAKPKPGGLTPEALEAIEERLGMH